MAQTLDWFLSIQVPVEQVLRTVNERWKQNAPGVSTASQEDTGQDFVSHLLHLLHTEGSSLTGNSSNPAPSLARPRPQVKKKSEKKEVEGNKGDVKKEQSPSPNLADDSEFPSIQLGGSQKRRIQPTRVSSVSVNPAFAEDRTSSSKLTLNDFLSRKLIERPKVVLGDVTDPVLLERVSSLLAGLLLDFLVPSVVDELFFLVQLLVACQPPRHPGRLFHSLADASFLASNIIANVHPLLRFLDPRTLHLLASHPRMRLFQPKFVAPSVHVGTPATPTHLWLPPASRDRFSSDSSYHQFRRQRELLLSLRQRWRPGSELGPAGQELRADNLSVLAGMLVELVAAGAPESRLARLRERFDREPPNNDVALVMALLQDSHRLSSLLMDELVRRLHEGHEPVDASRRMARLLGGVFFLPYADGQMAVCRSLPVDVERVVERASADGELIHTLAWTAELLSAAPAGMAQHEGVLKRSASVVLRKCCQVRGTPWHPGSRLLVSAITSWLARQLGLPLEASDEPELPRGRDAVLEPDWMFIGHACPLFDELRSLLAETQSPARKIPLQLVSAAPSLLRSQLEESFVGNQPASFRASLDFLAERLSSKAIRRLRASLPDIDQHADALLLAVPRDSTWEQAKERLRAKMEALAQSCLQSISTEPFLSKPDEACSMLAQLVELQPAVLQLGARLVALRAKRKTDEWVRSHLTLEYFYSELEKATSRLWRTVHKDRDAASRTPPLWDALEGLRNMLVDMLTGTPTHTDALLAQWRSLLCISHQPQCPLPVQHFLARLLVDVSVLYVIHNGAHLDLVHESLLRACTLLPGRAVLAAKYALVPRLQTPEDAANARLADVAKFLDQKSLAHDEHDHQWQQIHTQD